MKEQNKNVQNDLKTRRLIIRTDKELESLLLRRLNDPRPGVEATPEFWKEFKRRVEAGHRKRT
jgi:hypothetical protein